MGKLFVLIGKSASGKDFLMSRVLAECPHLKRLVSYTTRPKRGDEEDGCEYFFVEETFFEEKRKEGKLIEERIYQTRSGSWRYGTIDECESFIGHSYLAIKDPQGAQKLREYYGKENVVIIHVTVDDGIRLMRAINRELTQGTPDYSGICRRFLADEEDFKNITPDFEVQNMEASTAVKKLRGIIHNNRKGRM